jgi:hypothetical protein
MPAQLFVFSGQICEPYGDRLIFSIFTLIWQLFALAACCSAVGLALRFMIPKGFSLLHKALFVVVGGLFQVVLIPQNLVYLGVPVRISAWLGSHSPDHHLPWHCANSTGS